MLEKNPKRVYKASQPTATPPTPHPPPPHTHAPYTHTHMPSPYPVPQAEYPQQAEKIYTAIPNNRPGRTMLPSIKKTPVLKAAKSQT